MALSPAFSPLEVEIIDPVQLLVIIVICSFKKKIFAVIQASSFIIIAVFI